MNFVIGLAHNRASVAQWYSIMCVESKSLRFNSSWGSEFFSLSYACDKNKKHLFL